MKRRYNHIILIIITTALFLSCSNNSEIKIVGSEATCFDGIQNGNETGVDCGWSCSNSCEVQNGLEGQIVTRVILDNQAEYKLTGPLIIRDGGELEIREGTVIKVLKNKNAYIAVAPGGKIYIYGKKDAPVVITSNAENPAPGDWGGIVICGMAPTNMGSNSRSEVVDIFYGGSDLEDSSGIINYLRIEYSGAEFEGSATFSGLSFFGVGSFTHVENVQSFMGRGNGFSFFGGSLNTKWLLANNNMGDGISFTEGWQGNSEFLHLLNNTKSGIHLTNNKNNPLSNPVTSGTIKNASIIGPVSDGALHITHGGSSSLLDSIYISGLQLGIKVSGVEAVSKIDNGELNISTIQFDNISSDFLPTDYSGPNTSFYIEGGSIGSGNQAEFPDWTEGWIKTQ